MTITRGQGCVEEDKTRESGWIRMIMVCAELLRADVEDAARR